MWTYLWIACGGALGSVARYACSGLIARSVGEQFPWGTLAVNVAGSFLIGLFGALTAPDGRWLVNPEARKFFMIGVMGGFTTFSSFSLQTLELINDGEWAHAGWNVALSVALCLLGVWLGHSLAMAINSTKGN